VIDLLDVPAKHSLLYDALNRYYRTAASVTIQPDPRPPPIYAPSLYAHPQK
jgi:hypothetical protein